jgi:hypothetical protein
LVPRKPRAYPASRQGNTIRLSGFLKNLKVVLDFVDGLVAAGIVLTVTSFAVDVAGFCDLEP